MLALPLTPSELVALSLLRALAGCPGGLLQFRAVFGSDVDSLTWIARVAAGEVQPAETELARLRRALGKIIAVTQGHAPRG
jgi:hypothetical protein